MLGPFQTPNMPPTAAQEARAKDNNDKTHQIVMPDEVPTSKYAGPVILTFGGQNICLRMNPDGTCSDGSLGLYITAMALKAGFEYATSSPESKLVDSMLSMWTTRGWTANQKAGSNYVLALSSWLMLDWMGRPATRGSRIPGLASENAYLAFSGYQSAPIGDSGD